MGKQYQGRSRVGGVEFAQSKSGLDGQTMIYTEEVRSAVSELPEVEEDLKNTAKKLEEVSEPLEAAWIGTAREPYARVAYCIQQLAKKIESGVGGLHMLSIDTCEKRIGLDLEVADKAAIK